MAQLIAGRAREFSNPYKGGVIPAWGGAGKRCGSDSPIPGPQESFDHMQAQINSSYGPMMGFTDYATVPGDPKAIMQYYISGTSR